MHKKVHKKSDSVALKLASKLGVLPGKRSEFFSLYKSYKSTSSKLNKVYEEKGRLYAMDPIEIGYPTHPAVMRNPRGYARALVRTDTEKAGLERKLRGIIDSLTRIVDLQKIINDVIKAVQRGA